MVRDQNRIGRSQKLSHSIKVLKTYQKPFSAMVSEEITLQVISMIGQEFDQFRFKIDQQKCQSGTAYDSEFLTGCDANPSVQFESFVARNHLPKISLCFELRLLFKLTRFADANFRSGQIRFFLTIRFPE